MSKQITIYLSRALTFNRPGQEPLKLAAGHNTVDQEVAEDDFVKHFMTAEPVDVNEVHDLRARVAELEALLAEKDAELAARPAAAGAKAK